MTREDCKEEKEWKGEEGEDIQSGSTEESSSSVIPPVDNLGRIPVECTVDCLTCRCDHYPSAPSLKRWDRAYQYQ